MRKALLSLITIFCSIASFAQQDAQYSMYRFNGLYINPAYAGSHEGISATAMYRYQWVKMPGAPQSASVAMHSPLNNDHLALGLIYNYDRIGVAKTNSLSADLAYRVFLDKKKTVRMSIGISAGFDNYRADLNSIATTDADDPSFSSNSQNRWLPNVGLGVYFYGDKFFAAVAVPRILANRLNGKAAAFAISTNIARQYQNLLVSGGYVFSIGKKLKFVPSILFKYVPVYAPLSFDLNMNFVIIDRITLGAAYRFNDSYNFMLAVNATKQLRIGYSYDLAVSPLHRYTTGSHEVMVGFDLAVKDKKVIAPKIKYF